MEESARIDLSVNGFYAETRMIYEFCGCYCHGHTCLPFRDVSTMAEDTLVERYEQTIARLEQITRQDIRWKCNGNVNLKIKYWFVAQN